MALLYLALGLGTIAAMAGLVLLAARA